ncbi:hypothetical protein CRENPOLYSF2_300001 [Crenothrix polyspora]|uniref:AAA domain-containing protein n=1 Tax=Crenothrix polyspora TaxID=360316 RepID=A0A1R4H9J5_9GAMM|nr:hypothetical protein [Crenothrix polyspora]SJM92932.1 hypothetical protein CRENPOLYSF2_300001 [Crenothrix polyspora]
MKIDVKVKNLGKIKEAKFHIRPMTVITGPNGTGKSFFTKTLYSILNVINKNVYHESINQTIRIIQNLLRATSTNPNIDTDNLIDTSEINSNLESLKIEFEEASNWKIDDYRAFATSKVGAVEAIRASYSLYLNRLSQTHIEFNKDFSHFINIHFDEFLAILKDPIFHYSKFFRDHIKNELQDNFQISSLSELIGFGEEKIEIEVDDLLKIQLSSTEITLDLGSDFIDEVSDLSSVVFFESPAYWKVREALKSARNNQNHQLLNRQRLTRLIGKKNDDILTGVPKYFYDLDDVLNIKTKTEGAFKSATDILENALGGEFIFKGDSLSFTDKTGREISKNLVSFGMTNRKNSDPYFKKSQL